MAEEHIHDGSVEGCLICANVNEIQAGGMQPDGSMTNEHQAAVVTSALQTLPAELKQVIESGQGSAEIRKTLIYYHEILSGKPEDAPRPGDPRVQLAMACLQMNPENLLPGLKRRVAEVIAAALFMRPAVEEGTGMD